MKAIGDSGKTTFNNKSSFNEQALLDSAGVATRVVGCQEAEIFYSQVEPAARVMCVQEGSVKLSVVNEAGKKTVLEILGPGTFLIKDAWRDRPFEGGTAKTLKAGTVLVIGKSERLRALRQLSVPCAGTEHPHRGGFGGSAE